MATRKALLSFVRRPSLSFLSSRRSFVGWRDALPSKPNQQSPFLTRSWLTFSERRCGTSLFPTSRRTCVVRQEARRTLSTSLSTKFQSTDELNEAIAQWNRTKQEISVETFNKLLLEIDQQPLVQSDAVTYGLLLEKALQLPSQQADAITMLLLHDLLETVVTGAVAFGKELSSLPLRPVEWYLHETMHRLVEAKLIDEVHRWLERWWTYHEKCPERIPSPTSRAYRIVMAGWDKMGNADNVLMLLQEMRYRDDIEPTASHFELCLNALVRSATKKIPSRRRSVGMDAEIVLAQMNEFLLTYGSELVGAGRQTMDSTGRSYQTMILQNLKKVVHHWVESRGRKDVAARVTRILNTMDEAFAESAKSPADWVALAEAYSHAIRSWSFAATTKHTSMRKALAHIMGECNPTLQAESLLLRLEERVDEARAKDGATDIPMCEWENASIPLSVWKRAYGSAIAACGADYDNERFEENGLLARRLWERFKCRGYGVYDTELYNHFFHVFGRMGDLASSNALWREMMQDPNVKPDLKTFNWRLMAIKKSWNWLSEGERLSEATSVWNHLGESGFQPDIVSFNLYLSCYLKIYDIAQARKGDDLFHELLTRHSDQSCRASTVSMNTAIWKWKNLAKNTDVVDEKREALRCVLAILQNVRRYNSDGRLNVRTNAFTTELVTFLLDANHVEGDQRCGVLRLVDMLSHWPSLPNGMS